MIRQILIAVLGHVDHGKTTLLDSIRRTTTVEGEAGLITQSIGASIIPIETIKRVCGKLLDQLKLNITIPGILAIDTPGHAAFSSLRKRGGTLADIAILIVDINEGFKPQTIEAMEIIKQNKTPFVIVANKIDLIPGWKAKQDPLLLKNIAAQSPQVQQDFETKLYTLVGEMHEKFGIECERFDRVNDYTKQAAIIPLSAKIQEGIPELLMVLTGVAQKYLEQNLQFNPDGPARGTVLEVKKDKGLGTTLDVIIYDGKLKVGDEVVIGDINGPIITKIKGLMEPNPLKDMRDKKTKFAAAKEIRAASGVKIVAKEIENVVAGMPILGCGNNKDAAIEKVQQEVEEVLIETDDKGIIIKADSLGSLEAMINLLKEKNIPIRKANIGNISRKDVIDAESNAEKDPLLAVILGFNIDVADDAKSDKVKIITSDIIYKLLETFEEWQEKSKKASEAEKLDGVVKPCKIEILKNYIFRQSNPAICGVEVVAGTLKRGMPLMKNDGREITVAKAIQAEKETVDSAKKGKQVALSMPSVMVGRQINGGDTLYSAITEEQFRKLRELKEHLSPDEKETIKEIAKIKRKNSPLWGV